MTTPTPTTAAKLAALDELAGDLEARLLDAEEMAAAARVARRAHAERLSREDAEVIKIQLGLLEGLRASLAGDGAADAPANGPGADRAPAGTGAASDGMRPSAGAAAIKVTEVTPR